MSVCLLFLFCLRVFISRSHENRSNHCRMLSPCVSETGRIKVQKGNTVLPVVGWGGGGRGAIYKNGRVSCCIFSEGHMCVLVPTKM